MFTQKKLSNGMNVVLSPHSGTQALTALVFVPVGSRYEPGKVAGVSHFLEHMMFKGTKGRPSAQIIARTLDAIGASYNAYTSKEYTGYYIKADARHAELALDMLSDIYFDSLFPAAEIEKEKGAVIEEIKMNEDNPLRSIDDWFEETLFVNVELGRNIAGSIKTVSGLTQKNVISWHNAFYRPQDTIVVLAGKIEKDAFKKIKKYFDRRQKHGEAAKFVPLRAPIYASGASSSGAQGDVENFALKKKNTKQLQVMLGFPGLPYDNKMEPALTILYLILGGGMSSRLFSEVREKRGLAYLVRAGASQYRNAGSFYVHAGLDARNFKKAREIILRELKKIKTVRVGAKELADAKEQWRGRMVLAWEDSSVQAEWYASQAAFYKKILEPNEEWKKISAVSAANVMHVARKILDFKKMRIAVIGKI